MLKDGPLLAPDRIGTDGAGPYPPAIVAARKEGSCRTSPALRQQAPAAGDRELPLPGQAADVADRRLSILPHGTTDDPEVRGHATVAKGLVWRHRQLGCWPLADREQGG